MDPTRGEMEDNNSLSVPLLVPKEEELDVFSFVEYDKIVAKNWKNPIGEGGYGVVTFGFIFGSKVALKRVHE